MGIAKEGKFCIKKLSFLQIYHQFWRYWRRNWKSELENLAIANLFRVFVDCPEGIVLNSAKGKAKSKTKGQAKFGNLRKRFVTPLPIVISKAEWCGLWGQLKQLHSYSELLSFCWISYINSSKVEKSHTFCIKTSYISSFRRLSFWACTITNYVFKFDFIW